MLAPPSTPAVRSRRRACFSSTPRRLDASALGDARDRVRAADARTRPAWTAVETAAGAALSAGPFSVTDKAVVPPSGDKHDDMSQAPYWWPNPATPNGLPYVQRDGERNPEIDKT